MPELLVLQSVWGLDKCPGFDIENRLDDALEQVVAAGFDGVGVNLARTVRTDGVARAMNPLGLAWEGQVLVHDAAQLTHWIGEAKRLGCHEPREHAAEADHHRIGPLQPAAVAHGEAHPRGQ